MVEVNISMFYIICLFILHNALPEPVFIGGFVLYISFTGLVMPLQLHYIYVCIDVCVHIIKIYMLIFLCMLYNIISGCTSYGLFLPISILCMGYSSTVLYLHSHLYSYVC